MERESILSSYCKTDASSLKKFMLDLISTLLITSILISIGMSEIKSFVEMSDIECLDTFDCAVIKGEDLRNPSLFQCAGISQKVINPQSAYWVTEANENVVNFYVGVVSRHGKKYITKKMEKNYGRKTFERNDCYRR